VNEGDDVLCGEIGFEEDGTVWVDERGGVYS